jgi:hypothetical protein
VFGVRISQRKAQPSFGNNVVGKDVVGNNFALRPMVASSIAGGFVLTALSGVHREDVTSVCIASSPHACLNFKRFTISSCFFNIRGA